MTTTEKKTPAELAHEFVMPDIELGSPVMFHHAHDTTNPQLGFVVRIGRTGKNVVIRTSDRHVHESVKHVDDPRLDWNIDHRESGSWDYTPEWKRLEKERHDLETRVAALEHTATKTVSRRKKSENA